MRGLSWGRVALNEGGPSRNPVWGATNLVFHQPSRGCMNALGASRAWGEATGNLWSGLLRTPYGVDADMGANPVAMECFGDPPEGDRGSTWQGTLKGGVSVRGPPPNGRSCYGWLGMDTRY